MRPVRVAVLALLFVVTIGGTVYLAARFPQALDEAAALARRLSAGDWVLLLGATALFYTLDWIRFASLLSILGYPLPPLAGAQLTCVSYFVSNLTPSADLHLPAMVYLLGRRGVPPAQAAAVSVTKSIYMVTWILVVALAALHLEGLPLPGRIADALPWVLTPFLTLALLFLIVVLWPERTRRFVSPRAQGHGVRAAFYRALDRTAAAAAALGRSRRPMHLVCHGASVLFLFVYVFLGWLLCRAADLPLSPLRATSVFSVSLAVAYLAPVPGSIGVTEVMTGYLIDPAAPARGVGVAAVLRLLCWYGASLPGALLLGDALRRDGLAALRVGRLPEPPR